MINVEYGLHDIEGGRAYVAEYNADGYEQPCSADTGQYDFSPGCGSVIAVAVIYLLSVF